MIGDGGLDPSSHYPRTKIQRPPEVPGVLDSDGLLMHVLRRHVAWATRQKKACRHVWVSNGLGMWTSLTRGEPMKDQTASYFEMLHETTEEIPAS
ncbi:hypothetical protein V6N11_065220 [Hibiscus sabdariffa]|uniref:Uncharacterized protein n=2 Tax=Hibiscus sabdariffa TaxID=183260 RepID=A0ABR2QGB9_9ROSI